MVSGMGFLVIQSRKYITAHGALTLSISSNSGSFITSRAFGLFYIVDHGVQFQDQVGRSTVI